MTATSVPVYESTNKRKNHVYGLIIFLFEHSFYTVFREIKLSEEQFFEMI